jgi:hypothetical protein
MPLTQAPRWVVWKWELRTNKDGTAKWTKPPYQPRWHNEHAESDDPDTWGEYGDAVDTVAAGKADGVGFCLQGSDIGAADLDRCVSGDELETWAQGLCDEASGTYVETTVSGNGLRIIGRANGQDLQRRFPFGRTGAGLELYRNTARYITVSGLQRGACDGLKPIDALMEGWLARYGAPAPDASGLDFNGAGMQKAWDFESIIHNGVPEGQRSEAFQAAVWHLAGRGMAADAITDVLAKHPNGIGAKFADRLHAEVCRSFDKWQVRRRQSATGEASAATTPWPQIKVIRGELPRIVQEAELALISLGREIYQRGGQVVRPVLQKLRASDDRTTSGYVLVPVTQPDLVVTLGCAARFVKWDGRSKDWEPVDPPGNVAETYLHSYGRWKLPILAGVTGAPFLRPDGSVCNTQGYDAETGLLYKPAIAFSDVTDAPLRDEAVAALKYIDDTLLKDFPFVTRADKAVALSAILTALDRHNMQSAPLHAFTAPAAGTGKSKLVDIVSVLLTGHEAPVINQGNTEEELEKRVGAKLLDGVPVFSIDNCERKLESSFLCTVLTQATASVRLLGKSKSVTTPSSALICATGNNLVIVGDLTRRTLLSSLDAQCERPELREFDQDAVDIAKAHRGRLVAAGLTILAAWQAQGLKGSQPLGSFEGWSRRVRDALMWLGCADPVDTQTGVRADDPKLQELAEVMAHWEDQIGIAVQVSVQDVVSRSTNSQAFRDVLMAVAGAKAGGSISKERLGLWLRNKVGKIVAGRAIRKYTGRTYKLVKMQ